MSLSLDFCNSDVLGNALKLFQFFPIDIQLDLQQKKSIR